MTKKPRMAAMIVAAGKGSRMKTDCPKQFILMQERPILYYTISAFEQSDIDEIVIVTSKEYMEYVKEEIVEKYKFKKVSMVVEGGAERYESVYCGLKSLRGTDYVLVHDGARPFVTPEQIKGIMEAVCEYKAVIMGVKAKDTVKIINEDGFVESTPERSNVWNIQTPQAFEYNLLKTAYDKIIACECNVTDDAMVVEFATNHPIKVIEGSYRNIKITTPEDLDVRMFENLKI